MKRFRLLLHICRVFFYSIGWGGHGSSDQPTNAFYRGPEPFSEPESSAIRVLFHLHTYQHCRIVSIKLIYDKE